MCRPPKFRIPHPSSYLPQAVDAHAQAQPADKAAFREVFVYQKPKEKTARRPSLSINTKICRSDSYISIPVNRDETSASPDYEPAIAVNSNYDAVKPKSPVPAVSIESRLDIADHLVDTTVALIESIWKSANSSRSVPALKIFVQEFLRRSHCSFANLQLALLYIVRLKTRMDEQGVHLNVKSPYADFEPHTHHSEHSNPSPSEIMHFADIYDSDHNETLESLDFIHPALRCGRRMFLSALIVACKFLSDKPPSNQAWSTLAGLSIDEINSNERVFLAAISFDLNVAHDVYSKWTRILLPVQESTTSSINSLPATNADAKSETSATSSPTFYSSDSSSRTVSPAKVVKTVTFNLPSDHEDSEYDSSDCETDYEDYDSPSYVLI